MTVKGGLARVLEGVNKRKKAHTPVLVVVVGPWKPQRTHSSNCLRNFSYKIDYISFWPTRGLIAYALWYVLVHIRASSFLNHLLISWLQPIRRSNFQALWKFRNISAALLHLLNCMTTSARGWRVSQNGPASHQFVWFKQILSSMVSNIFYSEPKHWRGCVGSHMKFCLVTQQAY